jgi:hypothetical protein
MDSAHILAFADIPSKDEVKTAIMDTLKVPPRSALCSLLSTLCSLLSALCSLLRSLFYFALSSAGLSLLTSALPQDGSENKWWMQFSKRNFMNIKTTA